MKIEFRRTGERRYAVTVHRRDRSILEMNPAAGYDPLMPHDLLHYVVESEIRLRSGIFGQLAGGGNAGTFHAIAPTTDGNREAARRRRRLARRGAKLLREGRDDSTASERAVQACLHEWLTRRVDSQRTMRPTASNESIPDHCLDRILARLDALSAQWASLDVGESVVVEWPDGA